MTQKPSITNHVTPAGGNIFLDLGLAPVEAAALKRQSDVTCQKLRMRRTLHFALAAWMDEAALDEAIINALPGNVRAALEHLQRGAIDRIPFEDCLELLLWTGQKVELSIQPPLA